MLRMHPRSLFAVLLRRPWWHSAGIGLALGLVGGALMPDGWRVVGLLSGLPFLVIAAIAGWRGLDAPGEGEVERTAQALRGLAWPAFAQRLEEAFARDGWTVSRAETPSHDFVLERRGQRMLVAARRWKSARLGMEPLRALQAARDRGDGDDALCIALGEPSDAARDFAAAQRIALWQAPELTQALRPRRLRG